VVRALTYVLTLGKCRIKETAENAVLNANYMMKRLEDLYPMAFAGPCMHEFVITLEELKKEKGVSALDIAKALLDYGIHPPTMYFPMIVHEALMVEPTETESKETIDQVVEIFREVYQKALETPEALHLAPVKTAVGRLDEVGAARNPKLRYVFEE
jgi:glycine dehydrogenase subunit 2